MAAYCRVDSLVTYGLTAVHRDQLRTQHSVTSMEELFFYLVRVLALDGWHKWSNAWSLVVYEGKIRPAHDSVMRSVFVVSLMVRILSAERRAGHPACITPVLHTAKVLIWNKKKIKLKLNRLN